MHNLDGPVIERLWRGGCAQSQPRGAREDFTTMDEDDFRRHLIETVGNFWALRHYEVDKDKPCPPAWKIRISEITAGVNY